MSMIFIIIQIKFVDINNEELLKTEWKHKNKNKILDHDW
jgi:hypothetical protein